jgi:hypothetical protein
MAELWYYRLLGEEFGPVSETALRDLVTEGTVGASDEVRRSGEEHWQRAGALELGSGTAAADELADTTDLDSLLAGPASSAKGGAASNRSAQTAADELDGMLAPSAPRRRGRTLDEWHYRVSGQRFGPFDFDTLFEHAASGQFSRYDEIRPPGADEWVEAQTIVGLFSDEAVDLDAMLVDEQPLPASAAPKPASVRKQWYYRVLNQQLGPVDFEGLFDLVMEGHLRPDDDIRESDQTTWQRADSLVGLFPDDLSEPAEVPADEPADVAQEELAQDSEDAEWYFKMDEQQLGPVTFERLMQLAHSGRLQPSDPIRLTKLGSWMEAGSMVGLFLEEAPPEEPAPKPKPASSVAERPTGDADDWAAAVLSEPSAEPDPPRRSAPSQPRTAPAPAPREPEPAPAAAAALSIATRMAATSSAQRPAFTPSPKSSRKSSPGGGGGLSLPSGLGAALANPALLGAIGVVLLGVALYFVPWGSFFTPPVDDLTAQLEEVWGQVKPLYEAKAPASEWDAVAAQVKPKLAEIAKEATDRGAGPDPGRQMLQIASVLAGSSIPKVLDQKTEAKPTQIKTVDNFLTRLKEGG